MVNHFIAEFKRKHKKDISENKRAVQRLHLHMNKLSSSTQASTEIDSLYEGIDFYTSITCARFEEMNADLFCGTLNPVEKALRDAKLDKSQIHDEAEKYKAEDEEQRDKVSSKNSLESYAFNMKATIEDKKLQGKINDEDKQKILDKCNEIINWLDKESDCREGRIVQIQKELEKVCNPIITKLYQSAGGVPGGMPEGFPGRGAPPSAGASSRPTIEEVD
ncbi:Heat shock cognate 71 kDa protein [Heterocephalus glaber]|uniref:Heat shock cognate 71 kDa protein n=1 Tax=Heterocephalus glaber TaxID=10181 RepID=G5APS5_HETGA|nr:Heat shock cognate 71 kDa protein [Heterocephalus glaber]